MKQSLLILTVLGLMSLGCNSNKAATSDKESSTNQPPAGAASSATASSSSSTSANGDQDFIANAAKGNRAEVTLGKMVASKTKDPSVRQFAQQMVKDHSTALNELTQLAQSKNITLPEGLPDDATALQSKLSSATGKALDKDYMDSMVDDHKKDVSEFQDASQNAKDPDVKQWAAKTLPTLQAHLQKAEQIDAKVGGGKTEQQ
jgi:putative membrane protein